MHSKFTMLSLQFLDVLENPKISELAACSEQNLQPKETIKNFQNITMAFTNFNTLQVEVSCLGVAVGSQ